ncbi:uncharacterized protein LOC119691960 [Plutella xylostella]|uniref:uncharacterized protein LOC119691960 n=1 Tax=Plutella xylostella TaxID=51655 RepID=UPI00203252C1|nr:uncharacterized protein LOC119691960 [Plutella xylostella]XP_048485799.1 uncharacterized protein LOC119691960 [Plutella xylostella]
MALFMKQDFSPPILSRKWIAIKLRPNVLLHSTQHIVDILESGLLFREDSIEVEQEAPSPEEVWRGAGGARGGWLTRGERAACAGAVAAGLAGCPRSLQRSTLLYLLTLATVPVALRLAHRSISRGSTLRVLLGVMRDYCALARRGQACLKELSVLCKELDSLTEVLSSTHALLCSQQRQLAALLGRGCCALLGNCPWLHGQLPEQGDTGQLLQIHHAFLVMQSTFLKHLAAAHYVIPPHARATYRNHNERVFWIHNTLLPVIIDEFRENYEALDRMYRLVKNYGNKDVNVVKKPGVAINDSWMYSEVHCGVAKANLELKIALNKCSSLDMFLDSCALNKHDIDLEVLNKDIDALIEGITKSLNTTQSAQLKLKKLKSKFGIKNGIKAQNNNEEKATVLEDNEVILKIEDKEPESKDEVFYFVRTEDDEKAEPASDVTTAPGKKERETTKVVLNELKRKLVKREDLMRERERQALVNTMPQYKNHMPEFPRQITVEAANKKGCISKFIKKKPPKKLFRDYKIKSWTRSKRFNKKVLLQTLKISKINLENDVFNVTFEAKTGNRKRKIMISVTAKKDGVIVVNKWHNVQTAKKADFDSSGMSEGLSDVEAVTVNKVVHQAVNLANGDAKQTNEAINFKFSKKDLELTPSDSDSDFENFHNEQVSLLKDVRRHRVARKKNFPAKRNSVSIDKADEDESLKPMVYSFGTGMAMASVLQINNKAKIPTMAAEELFIGDGQVSEDSGNDEDA